MRNRIVCSVGRPAPTFLGGRLAVAWLLASGAIFAATSGALPAYAIGTAVGLGTASSYSVLGGQSVTNTGPSVLSGSVGVHPGSGVSGFPPGIAGGVFHVADAQALQAQSDLTTAYLGAAGQASDATVGPELGGSTLVPGVYTTASSTGLTGPLTLDARGDPNAVFIFQIGSKLTTASQSSVVLRNGARSCNVFWQIGSSATLGSGTAFAGTIMALTSISLDTGATIAGRALARNGTVSLDNNVLTTTSCAVSTASPSSSGGSGTATGTPTAVPTDSATAGTPSGTVGTLTESASASRSSTTPSATEATASTESPSEDLAFTGGGLSGPLIALAIGGAVIGVALVLIVRIRRTS
jgi:hypothetical protein